MLITEHFANYAIFIHPPYTRERLSVISIILFAQLRVHSDWDILNTSKRPKAQHQFNFIALFLSHSLAETLVVTL